ncbi:MAG: hypothetical protein V1816_17410 [Pseudomonadota bacterium]
MKYVQFFDIRSGDKKLLGELRLEKGKLVMSKDLAARWSGGDSYALLAAEGFETLYDPEKILEALPRKFTGDDFLAGEVITV